MTKLEALKNNLEHALDRLKEASVQKSTSINRDATIQRFEFTFELSWKLMQEALRTEGLSIASPKEVIRKSADIGLINNPQNWFGFLQARNLTVHTYEERLAKKIYKKAKEFITKVENLLVELEKRK